MESRVSGFRLTDGQFAKLDAMAASVGTTRNNLLGLLVDNAKLQPVEKVEVLPVAVLPVENKNRSAVR